MLQSGRLHNGAAAIPPSRTREIVERKFWQGGRCLLRRRPRLGPDCLGGRRTHMGRRNRWRGRPLGSARNNLRGQKKHSMSSPLRRGDWAPLCKGNRCTLPAETFISAPLACHGTILLVAVQEHACHDCLVGLAEIAHSLPRNSSLGSWPSLRGCSLGLLGSSL